MGLLLTTKTTMETKPDVRRFCVQIRTGVEIWLTETAAKDLMAKMDAPNPKQYITINGEQYNRADYVGCFKPESIEAANRRKNGEYVCGSGKWHEKREKCECLAKEEEALIKRKEEALKACEICHGAGYMPGADGGMAKCECLAQFDQPN